MNSQSKDLLGYPHVQAIVYTKHNAVGKVLGPESPLALVSQWTESSPASKAFLTSVLTLDSLFPYGSHLFEALVPSYQMIN